MQTILRFTLRHFTDGFGLSVWLLNVDKQCKLLTVVSSGNGKFLKFASRLAATKMSSSNYSFQVNFDLSNKFGGMIHLVIDWLKGYWHLSW